MIFPRPPPNDRLVLNMTISERRSFLFNNMEMMIIDINLRGISESTQESYLRRV